MGDWKLENWQNYKKLILPDIPNLHKIEVYEQHGGYEQIRKILNNPTEWTPKRVQEEVALQKSPVPQDI